MRIALTGAGGFLGWHVRAAARESGTEVVPLAMGDAFDSSQTSASVGMVSRVIHLAGVNRGSDVEVREGNVRFAQQLATSLMRAPRPPDTVVYANSTQAGNGSVYGAAKERASEILAEASDAIGSEFVDIRLPNLFGEHGRPFYNSVTATFCHLLAEGDQAQVKDDRQLTLLHAQNAADLLLGRVPPSALTTLSQESSVSGLLEAIEEIAEVYRSGEIPDISTSFRRDLFNTYRSFTFPRSARIELVRHADSRGSFFETMRSHGGQGQSSFSTTLPGVTRGDHFHRRKIERFTVLSGTARIALRRIFTDELVEFDIDGDRPAAVDMPTMWAHNITNTGAEPLYTGFWINELFDPSRPDTIPEQV